MTTQRIGLPPPQSLAVTIGHADDLMEVFSIGRATVYRTLKGAAPMPRPVTN